MYIGMSALLAESAQMNGLDYFLAVIALLAGLGAFLFGFKILSDNIEKLATNKLRRWFDKTSKSRLAGVGIGAGVTAIIQSSSATTVMVVGFVNVGLMSLFQATAVIMGANIGTTVTAYFSVIADIPFIEIITVLTCVGIFMDMLCKKDKSKTIGMMLAGLGLVFLGLEYMSMAMSDFSTQPAVQKFLSGVDNRFVLLLAGIVITAIVQSSSAVTSIVVVLATSGVLIGGTGDGGAVGGRKSARLAAMPQRVISLQVRSPARRARPNRAPLRKKLVAAAAEARHGPRGNKGESPGKRRAVQ